ncbi:hypothetical protein SK128_018695, partial [Halocaridina rubra]
MLKEEELPSPELKRFTTKELEELFALPEELLAKLEAQDPNVARLEALGSNLGVFRLTSNILSLNIFLSPCIPLKISLRVSYLRTEALSEKKWRKYFRHIFPLIDLLYGLYTMGINT